MAGTYYKYAERDADSQLNWAEVGREASGMLLEVNRVREEKKEAYNQATREEMNNIMNAPQGENQDANGFINNYAHDMINQMKIDEDLFKRGLLKERDYTLKRQNNMDGTKSLFEIQKLYQQKYKEKMDGVMSGKLQAMNIFNMGMVEGYGDFNNSKATIAPDGTVGMGLMENKIIDGKSVRVLSTNIAPVNVIKGKILHDVPTFDVDKETTNTVANFGSRKDILYKAATISGAGTITELMGPDFLATLEDPVDQKIVSDMNRAIDDQVSSFLSPYNLSSIMTQNLGKYNAESFTFDKDEASKDKNKILVKVDPNTQMTTLDDKGPNYEAQKKEASDWVRRDILRKMDQERSIKTTAQEELQESSYTKYKNQSRFRPTDDETPPPASAGEILTITAKNNKGKKVATGVTQKIQGLVSTEIKGVDNVATDIGYNNKNGTLEISGYQVSGKQSEGQKIDVEGGPTNTEGSNVVKKQPFKSDDISNASLLSVFVKKMRNPETGYNFSNVAEAKDYYKRAYKARAGVKTSTTFNAEEFYKNYKAKK